MYTLLAATSLPTQMSIIGRRCHHWVVLCCDCPPCHDHDDKMSWCHVTSQLPSPDHRSTWLLNIKFDQAYKTVWESQNLTHEVTRWYGQCSIITPLSAVCELRLRLMMRQKWKDVRNYVVNVNLISQDDDVMMRASVTWLLFVSKTEELFPDLWFGDVTFGSNNCKLISVGSLALNVCINILMTNNHVLCFIDCRQKTYFWCCIQDQTFKCSHGPNPYLALGAAAYLAFRYFRDWLFLRIFLKPTYITSVFSVDL